MNEHQPLIQNTPHGYRAECTCGKFAIGYFKLAASAKRAYMRIDHAKDMVLERGTWVWNNDERS